MGSPNSDFFSALTGGLNKKLDQRHGEEEQQKKELREMQWKIITAQPGPDGGMLFTDFQRDKAWTEYTKLFNPEARKGVAKVKDFLAKFKPGSASPASRLGPAAPAQTPQPSASQAPQSSPQDAPAAPQAAGQPPAPMPQAQGNGPASQMYTPVGGSSPAAPPPSPLNRMPGTGAPPAPPPAAAQQPKADASPAAAPPIPKPQGGGGWGTLPTSEERQDQELQG